MFIHHDRKTTESRIRTCLVQNKNGSGLYELIDNAGHMPLLTSKAAKDVGYLGKAIAPIIGPWSKTKTPTVSNTKLITTAKEATSGLTLCKFDKQDTLSNPFTSSQFALSIQTTVVLVHASCGESYSNGLISIPERKVSEVLSFDSGLGYIWETIEDDYYKIRAGERSLDNLSAVYVTSSSSPGILVWKVKRPFLKTISGYDAIVSTSLFTGI